MRPGGAPVVDAIGHIETLRRETENEAGLALACSSALHRLQELLDYEMEALRLRGVNSGHQANVDALRDEIGRVRALAVTVTPGPGGRDEHRARGGRRWRDAGCAPDPARADSDTGGGR